MITTVVGNYPKIGPGTKAPSLRNAIGRFDQGRITLEELRQIEDQVTEEVIQEQVDAGIDLVSDGQVRWDDGQTYFAQKIKGFTINGLIRYFDSNTYYRHPIAGGEVTWDGPISVADYTFAKEHSTKPVKAVITGPYTLARLSQQGQYSGMRPLVMDLAQVLNKEALALQEAGAPVIQFDEPAILNHKEDMPLLEEAAAVVTRGVTAKTELRTYFRDVSGIAQDLFRLPFQMFGLDFAWGPANFDLLDGFPEDKELVMGLLDARNTRLEPVEEILQGARRVSTHVSLDRVQISPSCGLDFLPRKNARLKLERLVEGAKAIQEELG